MRVLGVDLSNQLVIDVSKRDTACKERPGLDILEYTRSLEFVCCWVRVKARTRLLVILGALFQYSNRYSLFSQEQSK
jgi:hypothetical protein